MPRLEARWSGAEADPALLRAPTATWSWRPRSDRVGSPRRRARSSPTSGRCRPGGRLRSPRRPPTGWPSRGSVGSSRSPPAAACSGPPATAPTAAASRGGRRRSASTRGPPTCSGCWPPAQLIDRVLQHPLQPDGGLRGGRVRRQRGGAGRRRLRSSGSGSSSPSSCWPSPTGSGGGGSWSAAAIAAPLLAAVGRAGAVARRPHRHADAWPGRWPSRSALVVTIVAAEEMPPGSRAYAVSVLGLAYALGAGTCVWALPLADLGDARLAADLRRRARVPRRRRAAWPAGCPESRRYELPHAEHAPLPGRRFLLLAASAFLYNLLIAPTTFYENRYLKDVRGLLGHADRRLHHRHAHAGRHRRAGRRAAGRRQGPSVWWARSP